MTALNYADKIALGGQQASAVYLGSTKVWPQFKPTNLAGCAIWIDASRLGLADGAAVNAWPNLGSGPQPTLYGSPVPVLRGNALNGLPVVRLTHGGQLRFTGTGVDKDYTVIFVARRWTLRPGRVVAAWGQATNILWGFWGDRFECSYVMGWMVPDVVITSTLQWRMYSGDASTGGTARLFSNGALLRTHPTPPPSSGVAGTLNLGGYDDTHTEDSDSEIAEVVMYNRMLSDAERQQVEGYLRTKWNPISPFKPTDYGSNIVAWFDAADAASVQLAGSGVSNWINKGVGPLTLTQSNDSWRPKYANQTVTLTSPQQLAATNAPTGFDMVLVGRPNNVSNGEWRTLLRGTTTAHHIIIESGSLRMGTYNSGYFPAVVGIVSPTNMTSDTAPAPYVVTDHVGYPGYPPSASFDGNATTFSHSADPIATNPYWIKIDLGSPRFVTHYNYQARADGTGTLPYQQWQSWVLEGSNNDSTWTLVDTVSNVPDFTFGEKRTYVCDVAASFRYWRWTVTVATGYPTPYAAAVALELYQTLTWDNVWGLGYGQFGTGPVMLSRDGGNMVSTTTTLLAADVPFASFGAYQGPPPSQSFGDIKEVIFLPYNSDGMRQLLEGYLAWKWGLAGLLPAGHPYKSAAP
jgi:hypothetical protein